VFCFVTGDVFVKGDDNGDAVGVAELVPPEAFEVVAASVVPGTNASSTGDQDLP
jgi:hypothetical protein